MAPPTETAVVVRIPQAEEIVGPLRARLDPAAALGVPAHVTVIAPFAAGLDGAARSALAVAVASVRAFDVTFARVAWFGQQVMFLAPEPASPFTELTQAVWRAFPGYPPYGGAYEEVVPHLTVGMSQPEPELAEAARAIEPGLPIVCHVSTVTLMRGSLEPGSWRVAAEYPLAAGLR